MNKQYLNEIMTASLVVGIPLFITVLLHFIFSGLILNQKSTNLALNHELTAIQTELIELQIKKNRESDVVRRLEFLMNLRVNNFKAIRLLTELNKEDKQAILLQRIIRQDNVITFEGLAQSESALNTFVMTQSQANKLAKPEMSYLEKTNEDRPLTAFRLQMQQKE